MIINLKQDAYGDKSKITIWSQIPDKCQLLTSVKQKDTAKV